MFAVNNATVPALRARRNTEKRSDDSGGIDETLRIKLGKDPLPNGGLEDFRSSTTVSAGQNRTRALSSGESQILELPNLAKDLQVFGDNQPTSQLVLGAGARFRKDAFDVPSGGALSDLTGVGRLRQGQASAQFYRDP